jgi:hypothetical protein
MTMGADVVDRIGTTTRTLDLCGDGILDLRAALLTRKMMAIYEIGAKPEAECDIYDELSATVNVALDLIVRRVVEHLEGGGVTWGAVCSWMGWRQWAAAMITTMTMTMVLTTEEGELSGSDNGDDNVRQQEDVGGELVFEIGWLDNKLNGLDKIPPIFAASMPASSSTKTQSIAPPVTDVTLDVQVMRSARPKAPRTSFLCSNVSSATCT